MIGTTIFSNSKLKRKEHLFDSMYFFIIVTNNEKKLKLVTKVPLAFLKQYIPRRNIGKSFAIKAELNCLTL